MAALFFIVLNVKLPYIKFYPRDWQSSADVQRCSIAARGLWLEIIFLAAQSDRYGLCDLDAQTIAHLTRISVDECNRLLSELETNKVFSRCPDTGHIFCRRMVDDQRRRDEFAECGRRGGNPKLIPSNPQPQTQNKKNKILITHNPEPTRGLTPPLNPTLNPASVDHILLDFQQVWKLYPDKSGKEKSEKAYRRARKDGTSHADILAGLQRYVAYVQHRQRTDFPDLKFKNGQTWFGNACWKDECTITAKAERTSAI